MTTETITFTDGLRALADRLDAAGDVQSYESHTHLIPCYTRESLVETAKRIGGRWDKNTSDYYFNLTQELGGGVAIQVFVSREAVCERVVTGTEKVMQPAPDAPMVEVEREIVEWICPPSLLGEE